MDKHKTKMDRFMKKMSMFGRKPDDDDDDDDDERRRHIAASRRMHMDMDFSSRSRRREEEVVVGEDGYIFKFTDPVSWHPPAIVHPTEEGEEDSTAKLAPVELKSIETDAELYALKETTLEKTERTHTILKMPSTSSGSSTSASNTFNILMADVSGSMGSFWTDVEKYWNEFVAPALVGKSRIFTFDNHVRFRRSGTTLCSSDNTSGGTELTGALQTIVSEVYSCTQKYVNVFIITDGDHNGCRISPQQVIDQMEAPASKICNIFLLGAGNYFPVQYSIDIRSRLHNGSSNLPSLYWAKQYVDIKEQMEDIGSKVSGGASLSMKLNVLGSQLPGLEPKDIFHLREFVYLPSVPEEYKNLVVNYGAGSVTIQPQPKKITVETLFEVFRQWNSVIIQLKYRKETIPEGIIQLMERLFSSYTHAQNPKPKESQSLSERLGAKDDKRDEMEFRTLINGIKSILTEEKFGNQIELAEKILSTAVTRKKYEVKTLQLKGHTDKEYEADCNEFLKVYNEHKEDILKLALDPEYSCQTTKQSTLSDLQDESFPALMDKNKFDFLKSFTISGIPVFAPTRDSVTLNPWSYSVQRILKAPYTIMSQVAMEAMASERTTDSLNKEVHAGTSNDDSNFNAIVPVFPPSAAKIMQPIVRTRIYAMCVTFATLKNPHMIDFNVHMAALGVTWVRLLFENPSLPRPEHVRLQMESIEATAACYLDRPGFANYCETLLINTKAALMTESEVLVDNKPIRCESIVKPMFLLNMMQHSERKIEKSKLIEIMKTMLLEYVGRCLTHYKSEGDANTPYTDFFASSLNDQERKKDLVKKFVEDAKIQMSQSDSSVLESFYSLEKVTKAAKIIAKEQLENMKTKISAEIPAKVDMEKVKQLRNVSSAGDVSWTTLETYARVIGLTEDEIGKLFGEESIFVYTAHALKFRSSKERLGKEMKDYESVKVDVNKEVQAENLNIVSKQLYGSLVAALEDNWVQEYLDVHTEVVEPMMPQQIVLQAQQRGIQVTTENFDQIYKRYRPVVGLLGNACQTKACPYYLKPNKTYNQHASVERLRGKTPFVHGLHQVAYECRNLDLPKAITEMSSGTHNRDKKPIPKDDVGRWSSDIKKLKNIYKEQEKATK